MRRPGVRVVACLVILASVIGILASPAPRGVTAQQSAGTPTLASSLPAGVSVQALAEGATTKLPAAPFHLRLEQLSMAPGPATAAQPASGPELYYVQSGTLAVVDELGVEGDYPQGTHILIPMGARIDIHNSGKTPVGLLHLSLEPGATTSAASPAASGTPTAGGAKTIFEADITKAPQTPAVLFLYRVTWQPGSELDDHVFSGSVGVEVESGALSVAGPSGIEGQLHAGTGIVFPAGVPIRQRNAGTEPAVVLMAGVLPANQPILSAVSAAGTGMSTAVTGKAVRPAGTAVSRATAPPAVGTATHAPGTAAAALSTAAAGAGKVIYNATAQNGGFAKWVAPNSAGTATPGWALLNGMLIFDGTNGSGLVAPVDLSNTVNYAVETEIQWVRNGGCGHNYDTFVRAGSGHNPFAGGVENLNCGPAVYIADPNNNDLATAKFPGLQTPEASVGDNGWHTYRLEVQGNNIRLSVDGQLMVQTTDNRLVSQTGGYVGIGSNNVQINVRRFTVIALPSQ